jgi:mannosyltransferase OCH1-like enzyme
MIGIKIEDPQKIRELIQVKEKIKIRYPLKLVYNSVIPLVIYQTWHNKTLPVRMAQNILSLKKNNPRFQYYLFDDNDCERFIRNHFDPEVVNAYTTLIPGAYKADLWRYCVLYKRGGIYMDIKYGHLNHFKLITLTEKEHWVLDRNGQDIYNALIAVKPGNPILLRAIQQVVENVKNRYYGQSHLDPTGPSMLVRFFSTEEKAAIDMKHDFYLGDTNNRVILLNNIPVLRSYNGYLQDHNAYKKTEHYGTLWKERRIYR